MNSESTLSPPALQRAKKGCYRAFDAEHKHDGQDAVSLMKKFKECDVQEAQRLKRKWEGKHGAQ